MSFSSDFERRPPYVAFLELDRFRKGIGGIGAVVGVIAFGFVSVSIRMGGGTGWPLHDVLHPLLGLFLGPVYGPVSSIVGAGVSEVVTPYTALDGMSPLMGGVSALTSALLVRRGRAWRLFWGGAVLFLGGSLLLGLSRGDAIVLRMQSTVPVGGALVLGGLPRIRNWCRRQLASAPVSWATAGALYVVCFVASAMGLLPLWVAEIGTGTAGVGGGLMAVPVFLGLERLVLPVGGVLLGLALWPALRRRFFSVANQLRYGLPLFILATFLLAGRLFMEQAYRATRAEAVDRLKDQSRAAARTLDTEIERARNLLRRWGQRDGGPERHPVFRWVERVPAEETVPAFLSPSADSLVERARRTGRSQQGFVLLPDTAAHEIVMAVPLSAGGGDAETSDDGASVVAASVGPSSLRQILANWRGADRHLYLVNRRHQPVVESLRGTEGATADPASFVEALLEAPDAAAEVPRGRYETDVLGAVASLETVPGHVVVEQARTEAYFYIYEMLLTMAFIILITGGGALAVGFFVSRRVVAPLDRLIGAARRVGEGDLSTRVDVEQQNEIGELSRAFNRMTQDLSRSVHRLRASEERLRIALDAAQMGTWNWTADPEAVTWSPQTYALLNVPHTREEGLYEAFLARVHPEDRDRVAGRTEEVLRSETGFKVEHRIRPRRREERWVRVQGRVFWEEGRPQRMSGIIMDVTARKEAEQELVAAKEKAEEMSRLKSAFLANVSHEIRTPLTSIIGFAEILADEVSSSHADRVEKIVRCSHRLKQTLDSVLDLSMIEAGEFSLDCRPFDLGREVGRRVELLRPTAERNGLDLHADVPSSEVRVHLDPSCLDRILTNLVTNAIKFTEEGHVRVCVRAEASHVAVHVSDSGIGIADEFRPELFEAFKQESGGLRREHGGTGLGLSITKEMVELMEGEIAVESEKGKGTTFTVRLPYRVSEKDRGEGRTVVG